MDAAGFFIKCIPELFSGFVYTNALSVLLIIGPKPSKLFDYDNSTLFL
jgi:hypothetical protein